MTDFPTRPQSTVAAEKTKPNQGVAFDMMIHRIHTGENLQAMGKEYTIVGFGGSFNDFDDFAATGLRELRCEHAGQCAHGSLGGPSLSAR